LHQYTLKTAFSARITVYF